MYWDVKTVKPLPNYRIYVEIEDGRKGIFDLKPSSNDQGIIFVGTPQVTAESRVFSQPLKGTYVSVEPFAALVRSCPSRLILSYL